MKTILRILAILLTILILIPNLRLYQPDTSAYGPEQLGPDVLPQLTFISLALRNGAGEQMQHYFPEGYFFTYALYGLAWVEIGQRQEQDTPLRSQAVNEARWALKQLNTPAGQAPFSPSLDPPYGVFYVSWSTWLRGGILQLQEPEQRDPAEVSRFVADCTALAAAFDRSPTPFLSAYPEQAWPVDSVVAIAALRLHDTLLTPSFELTVSNWLQAARDWLDPATGLLPHYVDPHTGQIVEGARGSSQSIIQRFLVEIDPAWSREQYDLFRQQFVARPLGLAGVREYPHGTSGRGDVDSGPLILGLSASASVVTIGAAQLQGDRDLLGPLLNGIEALGLPLHWGEQKRYLLGLLPVSDAFVAWSKTARPWTQPTEPAALPEIVPWWWRLPAHVISLALVLLLWAPEWISRLRRRGRA